VDAVVGRETLTVGGRGGGWDGGSCFSKGWERCRGGDDTREPFADGTPALDDGGVGKSAMPTLGDSFLSEEGFVSLGSKSPGPVEICVTSWCTGAVPRCDGPA